MKFSLFSSAVVVGRPRSSLAPIEHFTSIRLNSLRFFAAFKASSSAIVQACRSVEGILGEPPNSKKQTAVFKHKEKWIELTGINPDSIFEKAGISYLDFYYELFFDMRNPSAHSYGNIHYELEKSKTVQAQCFAAIVVRDYFNKHVLNLDEAQKKLRFNLDLLNRVNEDMSTKLTK